MRVPDLEEMVAAAERAHDGERELWDALSCINDAFRLFDAGSFMTQRAFECLARGRGTDEGVDVEPGIRYIFAIYGSRYRHSSDYLKVGNIRTLIAENLLESLENDG